MIRVAFAGAQDTGKTTLAKEMSSRFRARNIITDYVEECARTYIGKWGSPLETLTDQLFILDKQIERELCVAPKCEVLFSDSPIFLSYAYVMLKWNNSNSQKDIDILLHMYDKVLRHGKYDIIIYLKPFREPTKDGIRSELLIGQNEQIDIMIRSFLDLHNMKYTTFTNPTIFERIEAVDNKLKELIRLPC
jgi:nicotinamide riboside kinase